MFRKTLLLISLCGLASLASAQEGYLSLEELVALKSVSSARMSPDGTHIAYTLSVPRTLYEDNNGPSYAELHVTDLNGNSRPFITGEVNVSSVQWSADGKSIFFLAKRDADAEFNSLYRIPVSGGESQKLFTNDSSIGSIYPSPDGATVAFIASDPAPEKQEELTTKGFKARIYEESVPFSRVHMLDLETLEATEHELDGHASSFSWASDGEQYAVALAPTPLIDDSFTSRDVYTVDTESGKLQNAIGSTGKLGSFAFSPDGERIAYIGSVDIHDPQQGRLYVASRDGGERREIVPNYDGHITDFAWVDDLTISWLGNRGVFREWQTSSITETKQAGPAPTDGPIILSVDIHPGQSVAAAVADTPSHPPEVYVISADGTPKRLTDSNPVLSERKLAMQEVIRYPARDGLELEALLIHPAKKKRGGNPLIVVAHGGPEANYSHGWLSRYASPGQVWAANGYAVIYPNYRGSTGRGVDFSKMGQNDYADEEFNDLVDAKRYLVDEGLVDSDKVGITGGSYGGYATMWSASALTEEYAAAVSFVGISNQLSKFGTGDIPYEMYNVHSRIWPWDDWMWMLERSPVYHAGKTKTPLLIMHGDQDPRVHPGQSMEMYRFVKIQTDTPVRLVLYPGEGHGNRNTAAQYDFALRLVRWMDHYLKGPGGEPPPYELGHAERLADATDE
ncbi:MAG: S9 family peptidase [Woeseiaceae bacterium]|nr:S9 family peptidase [Woeseiaceae bacterium]